MMMSEKGGDGGFDFRFDNRSNRSSGRGLAGTGGAGGHSGDENNLLELMVMQNAADAIRQEYIEEPSFRKSMFNEKAEDLAISRGNDLPSSATVVMMVVAFVAFGFCTICFKAVYLNYRTTIWEDIYGRGVAFFVCATISYLTQSGTQSIFDLRKTIRAQFLLRVVLISTAYIFLFLAIEWASSFLYVALILCVLPPVCKVVQRYALIDKNYSPWETLVMLTAIAGMFFLFQAEQHFVNKNKYINDDDFSFNNLAAYIYGIICIICWGIANSLLQKNRAYVHHTVDTFYVGFFTAIVVPAFILGYFSLYPTKLTYEWIQFAYFGGSGFLWWLFHTLYTQVMESDQRLNSMPAIYVYLVMTIAGDGIVRSKDLDTSQIIAFILIVGPNVLLILMRLLKVIRD